LADLNSPNVLAFHGSIYVVGAIAGPTR